MTELRERTDLNFLKAQISSDQKELNRIIRDINAKSPSDSSSTTLSSTEKGLPRSRVRKVKDSAPPYAQPQQLRLVEAPYEYESVSGFWNELGSAKYNKPWNIRTHVPAKSSLLNDGPR